MTLPARPLQQISDRTGPCLQRDSRSISADRIPNAACLLECTEWMPRGPAAAGGRLTSRFGRTKHRHRIRREQGRARSQGASAREESPGSGFAACPTKSSPHNQLRQLVRSSVGHGATAGAALLDVVFSWGDTGRCGLPADSRLKARRVGEGSGSLGQASTRSFRCPLKQQQALSRLTCGSSNLGPGPTL